MKEAPLFTDIGGHQSAASKTDEWLTPPEILAALGGWESFDLDPAAPIVQPYPTARATFTKASNGVKAQRGPVRLDELYRAFAQHPKTRRNRNYQAKIRQVLQRGPFERVERGTWRARA